MVCKKMKNNKYGNKNISFFIPAWNCEETISESVDSIIKTNLKEGDEIIIVDDASTDKTPKIIRDYENKYNFIKVITLQKNKGGSVARNTAVKNCKNEILFCLDSDNILVPNSIEKLKNFMIKKEADSATFEKLYYFKNNIKNLTKKWVYRRGIHTLADSLSGHISPIASGNYMFTKTSWKKAGGYKEDVRTLDTWTFGIRQLATDSKIVVMPNSFYYHRHGINSNWILHTKKGVNHSVIAHEALRPFFNLINKEDFYYIKKNKDTWFYNLNNHPIRDSKNNYGKTGKVIEIKKTIQIIKSKVKTLLKIIIKKIQQITLKLKPPTKKERELIAELKRKIKSLKTIKITKNNSSVEEEWLIYLSIIRKKLIKKDPRFFLDWEEMAHTMFHKARNVELEYLKRQPSWKTWKKALKESKIGNPKKYPEMPSTSGNLIHHAYSLSQLLDRHNINLNKIKHIFEFGGGYGSMARLIYQLEFNGIYTIFDLPEFTFLQEYFLKSLNLDANISINNFKKGNGINLISNINILPNLFYSSSPDLFIGTWSISESPTDFREKIFNLTKNTKYYIIAYRNNFNSIDNKKYFKKFMEEKKDYNWFNYPIDHLQGNSYLIGLKK